MYAVCVRKLIALSSNTEDAKEVLPMLGLPATTISWDGNHPA